jgi:hypothetical protein
VRLAPMGAEAGCGGLLAAERLLLVTLELEGCALACSFILTVQ